MDDKLLSDQYTKIKEATKSCSEICRYIVFALLALVWGFYCTNSLIPNILSFIIILMVMLILYLMIDTLQYFIPAIMHMSTLNKLQKGVFNVELPDVFDDGIYDKAVDEELLKKINKVSDITFILFKTKIILLFLIFILISIFIIMQGDDINKYVK